MKKLFFKFSVALLFLFSINVNAQSLWSQIGLDLDGEAAGDFYGFSTSISADGNTVAIGGFFNDGNGTNSGHVRIYKNTAGTWTQQGLDLDGEAANDYSGYSVSLSDDGNTVAIGAFLNDGGGSNSGHVRVYRFISGAWTQLGADIDGNSANNSFGVSVSLSADGNTVAIGAPNAEYVEVYKNIAGNWTLQGTQITGTPSINSNANFGRSVSLSDDGSTVAIGAFSFSNGTEFLIGQVSIYKITSGIWTQQGADIEGEADGDQFGYSVSLSADGNTVAIGARDNDGNGSNSGHVRVYTNIAGTWTQQGTDIDGEAANDFSGTSVVLSADGSTVAVGAPNNDGNGSNSGHVRIFKNIAGSWTQQGEDIDGEASGDQTGYSVALSLDGSIIAIGAFQNDGGGSNSGHVRVYQSINCNTLVPPNNVIASPATIACGESSNLSAISAGNTIRWYTSPTGGNAIGTSASGENFSVSPNTTMTYYAEVFITDNCASTRIPVTITVNSTPPAPPTNTTATPSSITCGQSSNLNATSEGNTIAWYTTTTGGNAIGTSASGENFSVSPNTTMTYYAETVTNSSCTNGASTRIPVTITVNSTPPAPPINTTATPSSITCGQSSNLNATSEGNTIAWYTTTTGGNAIGTSASGENFSVSPNTTMTYYAETVTNSSCPNSATRTPVTVEYSFPQPTNAIATPSVICSGETANLNATSEGNTINWYTTPTGGNAIGTSASGENFSVSPTTNTTFYAEASINSEVENVYFISSSDLINLNNECSGTSNYPYSCSGDLGFQWTDLGEGAVTSVQIEFVPGIECDAGNRTTTLNGIDSGTFSSTQDCNCTPTNNTIVTLNPSTTSYNVSGTNTFLFTGLPSCFGLSKNVNQALGDSFAKITVTTGSICVSETRAPVAVTIIAPEITCPSNISINATSVAGAIVNYTAPTNADNCPNGTTALINGLASGSTFPIGNTTVIYEVTDAANNTGQCSFTVTVSGLLPEIICPIDITQNNDIGQCGSNVSFTATETVGIPASTITYSQDPGTVFPVGTTTVTATATNVIGTSTCEFDIIVLDNEAPVANCISSGSGGTNIYNINTAANPAVGGVCPGNSGIGATYNCAFDGGPAITVGSFTDLSGAGTIASMDVTLYAACNGILDLFLNGVPLVSATQIGQTCSCQPHTNPGVAMNISVPLTPAIINAYNFGGVNNLTVSTSSSEFGAVCIYGADVQVSVGGGITVQLDASGNASIVAADIDGGSTDNCAIATTSIDVSTFTCADIGANTVTLTVTDVNGNSNTCTTNVTVEDIINPEIICPSNITDVIATSENGAVVTYTAPTGNDNCTGATTTLTEGFASGATFPIGTTTVSYTITDPSNNTATCSFDVEVIGLAPVINCPADITQNNDAGQCGANVTFEATDTVGIPASTISYDIQSGSFFDVNTTTVTATATNAIGSTSCTFTVTVNDTEAPVGSSIQFPAPTIALNNIPEAANYNLIFELNIPNNANWDTNSQVSYSVNNAAALNNIPFTRVAYMMELDGKWVWVSFDQITQNYNQIGIPADYLKQQTVSNMNVFSSTNAGVSTGTGIQTGNVEFWSNSYGRDAGNGSIPSGNDGLYDFNDNSNFITDGYGSFQVHNYANAETLFAFNAWSWSTSNTNDLGIGNNTTGNPDWTFASNAATYNTKKIYVLALNNSVVCNDVTLTLDTNGQATLNLAQVNSGATDNCGVASSVLSQTSFDCSNIGENTVTLTITDIHGNSSTCTSTITIIDNINPTITCAAAQSQTADAGQCDAAVTVTAPSFTDNCTTAIIINDFNGTADASGTYPLGATTVTWTVDDGNGQTASCTQVITVTDDEIPVINDTPANISVSNDSGNCDALVTWSAATVSDNCPLATISSDYNSGDTFPLGITTVTYTASDANGNDAVVTIFTITVTDDEDPTITCAAAQSQTADAGQCDAAVTVTPPSFADNCTTATITNDFNGTDDASGTYPLGDTTVTWTVNDGNGQSAQCTQIITVTDNEIPVINGTPANISVSNDSGSCDAAVTWGTVTVSDNCPGATISSDYNSGDTFPLGTTTVTYTASDANGNNAVATSFTITVTDDEDPTITCAAAQSQTADAGQCDAAVTVTPPSFTDNCTTAIITNDFNGTADASGTYPLGATTVTWTVDDGNGQTASCTQVITVTDDEIPVINDTPANISVSNDSGSCDAAVTWGAVTVSDNCPGASISSDYNSGDTFPLGTTTVNYTAFDAAGNNAVATSFTVTVTDDEDPVAICPADITVSNDPGDCSAVVNFNTSFTDNCTGGSVVAFPTSGSTFDVGTTPVTVTATDATGNTDTCTFNVTVVDDEAPIVDCFNLSITLDEFGDGAIDVDAFILANGSTDNCEIDTISLSESTFNCDDIGGDLDELIISEYVDGTGNNDWIEIYNGTGNTIVLGEPVNGNLVSYYSINIYSNGSTTPSAIGLLGSIDDRQVYKISHTDAPNISGNPTNNFGSGLMVFDGNDAIALVNNGVAVDVIGVIGINPGASWSSTSNSTNGTTLVRNETVQQGNVSSFVANFETEWTQFSQNNVSNLGDHEIEISNNANNVILTVTDIHGNVATCEGSVTVVDATLPIALCQNVTVQLDVDGNGSTTAQAVDNGSEDACGIASLALSQTQFSCANIGPNPVTLTVTDSNGNVSTCNATVTVEDNVAPEALCQPATVQLDANGQASITIDDIDNGSNDACGIASRTLDITTFTCADVNAPVTVTLTVTDINGKASTCQTTVTVEDNVDPEALCQPVTVQLDANGEASIDVNAIDNGSNDACGIASRTLDITEFTCTDVGAPVTVVLTVTDNNGNTSTCESLVTVLGDIPTVSINAPEELPEFCQGAVLVLTTTATDAASYLWSPGGETTESIEVGPLGGTFTVTVTSATNCSVSDTFTVAAFDESTLLSAYTILAEEEVFLHGSNLVQSGGIGATDANGLIKLHQATNVIEFGRAANIVLNQGSTIVTPIYQPAEIPFPDFVFNDQSNNASPDVTINTNQSTTLGGSVYGTITVRQGATVTFSQSDIYIDELRTFDGAAIEFSGCANVFINTKFMLAQNGTINANGNNVVMYVNEDVQIEKGSYVRARIHSNGNELLAKGPNGNANNSGDLTQMIGLFIAKKVHGNKNVVWNADDLCAPCPISPTNAPIIGNNNDFGVDAFDVLTWPNPSDTEFNVQLKTLDLYSESYIEVFDISNKLVFTGTFKPQEVYAFGKQLDGGVYIVKVQQGQNSKTIRLVKY